MQKEQLLEEAFEAESKVQLATLERKIKPSLNSNESVSVLAHSLSKIVPKYSFVPGHKKQKDSLQGSLDRVLLAAELVFMKILVPRQPQNSSTVNIECARMLKQLYPLCDQLLGALIYLHFNILILICF